MNVSFRVLVVGVVACLSQSVWGQYPVEYPVSGTVVSGPVVTGPVISGPVYYGEETSVVDGGVYYAAPTMTQNAQNVGTVSYSSPVNSGVIGASSGILDIVNQKRRRSGLSALQLDVGLEQIAQSKSNIRANRRITGHDNSHRGNARVEGVGHAYGGNLSQRFNTCYLYSNGFSHAGAAIAYDNSGQAYYTLLLR